MTEERLPFQVTLLLWLVLSFTAWSGLRFLTALTWNETLARHTPVPGVAYLAASGLFWATLGAATCILILRYSKWAKPAILLSAAGYTLWYWLDRLFLQSPRENWLFTLVVNSVLLLFVIFCIQSNFFRKRGI